MSKRKHSAAIKEFAKERLCLQFLVDFVSFVFFLVASLMNSLHQLKADNARLEERLVSLTTRKNQLLQVNARLATPMSCTNTSSTASPSATKQTTPNSASTAAVSTQDTLTADTRTTPSSEGPRSAVSACANGAAVLGVCPGVLGTKVSSVTEGKAPMSANTKQGSVMGGNEFLWYNSWQVPFAIASQYAKNLSKIYI